MEREDHSWFTCCKDESFPTFICKCEGSSERLMWWERWRVQNLDNLSSDNSLLCPWTSHFSSLGPWRLSQYLHGVVQHIWCPRMHTTTLVHSICQLILGEINRCTMKHQVTISTLIWRNGSLETSHFICRQREDESFLVKGTVPSYSLDEEAVCHQVQ